MIRSTTQTLTNAVIVVQTNSQTIVQMVIKMEYAKIFLFNATYRMPSNWEEIDATNANHAKMDRSFKIIYVLLQDQSVYAINLSTLTINAKIVDQGNWLMPQVTDV